MVNESKFPWNDHDYEVLERAKKRCGEIHPKSPCVKRFRKYGEHDYSVICKAANQWN